MTEAREFDLNIERVLENWTVPHAIREVIANALDEAALTGYGRANLALVGGRPDRVRENLISTTMRLGATGFAEAAGLWEPKEHRIVIRRDQLRALAT